MKFEWVYSEAFKRLPPDIQMFAIIKAVQEGDEVREEIVSIVDHPYPYDTYK